MSIPTEFMGDGLTIWTNHDAKARSAVLRARFTEDVRFHDADGVCGACRPREVQYLATRALPCGGIFANGGP